MILQALILDRKSLSLTPQRQPQSNIFTDELIQCKSTAMERDEGQKSTKLDSLRDEPQA